LRWIDHVVGVTTQFRALQVFPHFGVPRRMKSLLTFLALLAATTSAHAEVVASENFLTH
jgi:hypothetical protein